MKPKERECTPGCLERGNVLWLFSGNRKWMLNHSNNNSNEIPQGNQSESSSSRLPLNNAEERTKNLGLIEKQEPLVEKERETEGEGALEGEKKGDQDPTEDVYTEASTEVRSLNSDEWLSLEREHPINGNAGRLVLQHFIDGSFIDDPENTPERSLSLRGSDGQLGPEPSQRKRNASSAAPPAAGARRQSKKRKSSLQSDPEAGATNVQSEQETSLDNYCMPGQPGHLVNPENRALIGAGETLDEWIEGRGNWPGEQ